MKFEVAAIVWLVVVVSLLAWELKKGAAEAAKQKRLSGVLRRAMGVEEAAS